MVGEEAPHLVSQMLLVLSGLIGSEHERELWWHAAEVLKHLSVPEGLVRAVEEALRKSMKRSITNGKAAQLPWPT